jgi:hypothetical protein
MAELQNLKTVRPECARPRAQRLPLTQLAGNCVGPSFRRELLWPGTATLSFLKTRLGCSAILNFTGVPPGLIKYLSRRISQ